MGHNTYKLFYTKEIIIKKSPLCSRDREQKHTGSDGKVILYV